MECILSAQMDDLGSDRRIRICRDVSLSLFLFKSQKRTISRFTIICKLEPNYFPFTTVQNLLLRFGMEDHLLFF